MAPPCTIQTPIEWERRIPPTRIWATHPSNLRYPKQLPTPPGIPAGRLLTPLPPRATPHSQQGRGVPPGAESVSLPVSNQASCWVGRAPSQGPLLILHRTPTRPTPPSVLQLRNAQRPPSLQPLFLTFQCLPRHRCDPRARPMGPQCTYTEGCPGP